MHTQRRATVRPFRPEDRDAFLDLYEAVWGTRKSEEWFAWRFAANPYVEEVPMVVAEANGELVGAEPCLAVPLRAGDASALAFQPADWMVHPDHRRRGLFTEMTERLLDRYEDGPPDYYYNFPSAAILPGLQSFDWREVGTLSTHYRVQDLSRLAAARSTEKPQWKAAAGLGHLAAPVVRGLTSLSGGGADPPGGWTIDRHGTTPTETLVDLYESSVPKTVHVRRDPRWYRWRLANPRWDPTTYVVNDEHGTPVAALVAVAHGGRGESDTAGPRKVSVLDVVPADGSAPTASYEALLSAVVADADDADVLKCAGASLPRSVLRRYGFRSDDEFPLSMVSTPTRLVVRPTVVDGEDNADAGSDTGDRVDPGGSERWRLGTVDLTAPENWSVQLTGQDLA